MATALSSTLPNTALAAAERRVERDRNQVQEARQRLARSQEQLQRDERERDALKAETRVPQPSRGGTTDEPAYLQPVRLGARSVESRLGRTIDVYA